MKQMWFILFSFVVAFGPTVSFSQESGLISMPNNIERMLNNFIGTWHLQQDVANVKFSFEWDTLKNHVVATGHGIYDNAPFSTTKILCWDGVLKDGIITYQVATDGHYVEKLRTISERVLDGSITGIYHGKTFKSNIRIEFTSQNKMTWIFKDEVVDGKIKGDWIGVFERIKDTSS